MTTAPSRDGDVLTDEELDELERAGRPVAYEYDPHPRQRVAHATYADELLYGGAAGGGKSRFARAEALAFLLEVPGAAAVIFRRTFPDLSRADGVIPSLLKEVPKELGTYNAGEHIWRLHNGSTLELSHLGRDADVTKYQGAAYQLIVWEEATQFTEYQVDYLRSRVRASGAVAARMRELGYRPRMIFTANPGGVGHAWVKTRWIDPAPPNVVWRPTATLEEPKPGTRAFIPAKVSDNPSLDESYSDRLSNLEEDLRRALLEGDWDVYQGQRFRTFRRATHVVEPERLPVPIGAAYPRAVGVDYGLDAPFCALWGAVLGDGLVVVYRELYKAGLTADEQADAILDAEAPGERGPGRPIPVALDPSSWARSPREKLPPKAPGTIRVSNVVDEDEPPPGSIAAAYRDRFGRQLRKAINRRLDGVSLVGDKLRVRRPRDPANLRPGEGLPRLLIHSTCVNLIRTLPALPRSQRNPEDVDTTAEDHAYDALRYLLMELAGARPLMPPSDPTGPRPPSTRAADRQLERARRGDRDRTVTGGIGSAQF